MRRRAFGSIPFAADQDRDLAQKCPRSGTKWQLRFYRTSPDCLQHPAVSPGARTRPDIVMIRHLAFFETLAQLDESSPRWTSVSAGLLVMRAFDSWVESGEMISHASVELAAVRQVVSSLPNGPSRALLDGIIQEIRLGQRTPASVLPRLLAYGRALHFESEWALASDVTARVAELARQFSNDDVHDDLTLGALQQLG